MIRAESHNQPSVPHSLAPMAPKLPSLLRINMIRIEGNAIVSTEAILTKVPWHAGELFDPRTTGKAIRAIRTLGYFSNVQIATEPAAQGKIDLIIRVFEKRPLSGITLEGNANYATEKLLKKIEAEKIKTLDEEEMPTIAEQIRKTYRDDKARHHVMVTGSIKPSADGKPVSAHFVIKEGCESYIRRVSFEGACNISHRALRSKIFTREIWPLGFMDRAGTYHPTALMQDRYTIENFYQSRGYLTARVVDAQVTEDKNGAIDVLFIIDEGELYTVSKVSADDNEALSEQEMLTNILYILDSFIQKTQSENQWIVYVLFWANLGLFMPTYNLQLNQTQKQKQSKFLSVVT